MVSFSFLQYRSKVSWQSLEPRSSSLVLPLQTLLHVNARSSITALGAGASLLYPAVDRSRHFLEPICCQPDLDLGCCIWWVHSSRLRSGNWLSWSDGVGSHGLTFFGAKHCLPALTDILIAFLLHTNDSSSTHSSSVLFFFSRFWNMTWNSFLLRSNLSGLAFQNWHCMRKRNAEYAHIHSVTSNEMITAFRCGVAACFTCSRRRLAASFLSRWEFDHFLHGICR